MARMPKPKKADRLVETKKRKAALRAYRHANVTRAIERDGSLCIFCYFLDDERIPVSAPPFKVTPREEVHHVYGRGREAGDRREHYTSLACTCKSCHPLPIQTPGGNEHLEWVETALRMANDTPINKRFIK